MNLGVVALILRVRPVDGTPAPTDPHRRSCRTRLVDPGAGRRRHDRGVGRLPSTSSTPSKTNHPPSKPMTARSS
jgi:hypothetical protein